MSISSNNIEEQCHHRLCHQARSEPVPNSPRRIAARGCEYLRPARPGARSPPCLGSRASISTISSTSANRFPRPWLSGSVSCSAMALGSGRECRAHMILGMRNANCPTRSREYRQSKRRWREKMERPTREINEYLDLQVAAIQKAVASLDRGEGASHEQVKEWVSSWSSRRSGRLLNARRHEISCGRPRQSKT